jgi:hypothetical protein
LATIAPKDASTRGVTFGACGAPKRWAASHAAYSEGTTMTSAITLPVTARRASGHPRAMKMRTLTAVSSRKSTLSASKETDPATTATVNSMKK